MGFEVTVEIVFAEEGARAASEQRAIAVVIDALRASATTATALSLGVRAVLPVLTVEEASTYIGRPHHKVAGERGGARCPGFDYGNSPLELKHAARALNGQTLVLSTSNGTRIVSGARGAEAILMGTTLNARAVARAAYQFARERQRKILLIAAGEYGEHAEEDMCGARRIAAHLHRLGAGCPADSLREEVSATLFHMTPSAAELRTLGYEQDIDYCAQCDVLEIVPVLQGDRFVSLQQVRAAVA